MTMIFVTEDTSEVFLPPYESHEVAKGCCTVIVCLRVERPVVAVASVLPCSCANVCPAFCIHLMSIEWLRWACQAELQLICKMWTAQVNQGVKSSKKNEHCVKPYVGFLFLFGSVRNDIRGWSISEVQAELHHRMEKVTASSPHWEVTYIFRSIAHYFLALNIYDGH